MLCEWGRVRGEHPPPILARVPQGARAFIFIIFNLSARWAKFDARNRLKPKLGALTVFLNFIGARPIGKVAHQAYLCIFSPPVPR
jgi:hypothetical protein